MRVNPPDIRFPFTRVALFGGLVALLPLPWAQNCDGDQISGLAAVAAEPASAAVVFTALLISAALLFVARRLTAALPRTLVHVLAAVTSSQALATLLSEMTLAKEWYAAGTAAVVVVIAALLDAAVRGTLSARPFARSLLADRATRWLALGAAALATLFVAGGALCMDNFWSTFALALPGAASLLLTALIHFARRQGALPSDTATVLATTALAGGALLTLATDPGEPLMQAGTAIVLLCGAPLLAAPVLDACRGSTSPGA